MRKSNKSFDILTDYLNSDEVKQNIFIYRGKTSACIRIIAGEYSGSGKWHRVWLLIT